MKTAETASQRTHAHTGRVRTFLERVPILQCRGKTQADLTIAGLRHADHTEVDFQIRIDIGLEVFATFNQLLCPGRSDIALAQQSPARRLAGLRRRRIKAARERGA